jgi:uncharacterized lipoprotein
MNKSSLYVLPTVLLLACGESSERYRDTHHLEMPPELTIEHTHHQPAVGSDDLKPKAAGSVLAGLMEYDSAGGKPKLTLKTRPERAWEMISTALRIANINVLDKNREKLVFQVRYDPDVDGKDVGFIRSLLNNDYPEADYSINLMEESAGMRVNVAPNQSTQLESDEDGSAELLRLLHQTIDEKIINRSDSKAKPE